MPTPQELYQSTFQRNCDKLLPLLKKILSSGSEQASGNYYLLCLATGELPLLLITLKKLDKEGNTVRGRGKAQKASLVLLKSAKWATGDILVRKGKLYFLHEDGTAKQPHLLKKAFREIAAQNTRLNLLRKVRFQLEESQVESTVDGGADTISLEDLTDLCLDADEATVLFDAMQRDPSLVDIVNAENQNAVAQKISVLNDNAARADRRTRFDNSGLPYLLEMEVGEQVPASQVVIMHRSNHHTLQMIGRRHQLSAKMIIETRNEALTLPQEERADYIKERLEMLTETYEATVSYRDAFQQSSL